MDLEGPLSHLISRAGNRFSPNGKVISMALWMVLTGFVLAAGGDAQPRLLKVSLMLL